MTKQTIDIGIQGNDGTGDSIRESFRKVNENFNEIYAVFGAGGTIGFRNLSDGSTYTANQVIMASNAGDRLTARSVEGQQGISVDTSDEGKLIIRSEVGTLSDDNQPALGAPLNANNLPIGRLVYPSEEAVLQFNNVWGNADPSVVTTLDDLAVSVGYANDNYVRQSLAGTVIGPLRVRDEPSIPQTSDPAYDPLLSSNYVSTEAMQRKDTVYRGGDTMTGPLTLSDHPSPLAGAGTPLSADDLQAATKYYVDNNTYSSNVNLYVTSKGDDLQSNSPIGREGRYWQYAYRTIGAAALQAENLIELASQEPGPYRQRLAYTIGPDQTFSTIQDVELVDGNTQVAGYQDAYDLLQLNKEFIQAETIAYINKKYVNTLTYDKAQYANDIRLILEAVGNDLVVGSTYNSYVAATDYYRAHRSDVVTDKLIQTIDAVKFARDQLLGYSFDSAGLSTYMGEVIDALCYDLVFQSNYQSIEVALAFEIAGTDVSPAQMAELLENLKDDIVLLPEVLNSSNAVSSFENNISLISNFITTGVTPTLSIPALVSTTTGQTSAKELLLNNISFIQAEVIAFLGAEFPNLSYNRAAYKRDVQFIVRALVYDFMYGGNSQSIYTGNKYWNGLVRTIGDAEVDAVVAAIGYIDVVAQAIITNQSPAIIYQQSFSQYRNDTLGEGDEVSTEIAANIVLIQSIVDTHATPTITYPDTTAGANALEDARTRVLAEKAGYRTDAIVYVEATFPVINDPIIIENISDLFQIIIDALELGISTVALPTYTSPAGLNVGYTHARQALLANLDFIADEAIAYININYPTFFDAEPVAGPLKTKRDIKYIVEAVGYDITYGSNTASIYQGKTFWLNGTSTIAGQELEYLNTIAHSRTVAVLVAQNSTVTPTSGNSTPQVDTGPTDGSIAASAITSLFNIVNTIIEDNPDYIIDDELYPRIEADLSSFDSDYLAVRSIIFNNKAQIANDTIAYLDNTYKGGFNYNEATCRRDVGYIIDAMSIDIITGGTFQTVYAGKSYYKNSSAKAIAIGTQYTETVDGVAFAKSLGLQVLNQTTATRYQLLITQVLDGGLEAAEAAIDTFDTNMTTVLNIIQYGFGAAPVASFGTGIWKVVISNGGNGYVDQGSPENNDIIPAKVLVGIESAAYGNIVKYIRNSNSGVDTIQVRLTKPGFFQIGEQLEFGETVKDINIVIQVESGIYYEDYPIRVPANCSIRGDEFRRTIIRPRDRISQSPWRKIFFYRDAIIDALEVGIIDTTGTDYSTSSEISLGGIDNKIVITLGEGQAPSSWIGKVVQVSYADQGSPVLGESRFGKAVVDSVSGNFMNCSVIYPFYVPGTVAIGDWALYGTINYARHYLTDPLDVASVAKNNKEIDVFLCNDAVRISNLTFQGHGGFAMVLDPEGQIKTKSPYGQVASSFSQSNNRKRFAGGQFVDGFTGRLKGTITDVEYDNILTLGSITPGSGYSNNTYSNVALVGTSSLVTGTDATANITVAGGVVTAVTLVSGGEGYKVGDRLTSNDIGAGAGFGISVATTTERGNGITVTIVGDVNSGLDIRPPQAPCAFFVEGYRYQINDIVSFNSTTKTVVVTMDTNTPYDVLGSYNNTEFNQQVDYVLDAATYDLVLGSNYQSIKTGISYTKPYSVIDIGTQKTQAIAGFNKARDLALANIVAYPTAQTALTDRIEIITTIIDQGSAGVPTITYPTPVGMSGTDNKVKAKDIIIANREFLQYEVSAFIAANYPVKNYPTYNSVNSQRDIGYTIDAIVYDLLYGGNSQTIDVATSFYSDGVSYVVGAPILGLSAQTRLKAVLSDLVVNTPIIRSPGNNKVQNISLPTASGAESTTIETLCDFVIDYIADGDFDSAAVKVYPTITGQDAGLQAARTAIINDTDNISTDVVVYLNNGGGLLINIEMGGNKSMLANDFAMINDLGYAIVCTNGGVSEQVSTFTYYCHTHYWANNGGQIRSVAGSNAHGTYGLRASGYDVTEKPDAVTLANDMVQTAHVYKQGVVSAEMAPTVSKQALSVWIKDYSYAPMQGSELEIDHTLAGGQITRYEVNSVEHTSITINGVNILRLNLGTAGSNGTSSTGLAEELYDGQLVTLRMLTLVKFNNIANVNPTRPSTALQYNDNLADIYRILAYNLTDSTGELLSPSVAVLGSDASFTYYKFIVDIISMFSADTTNFIATSTFVSGSDASTTLVVGDVTGTIAIGHVVGGYGFKGQTVENVSGPDGSDNYTITLSGVPNIDPFGTITFGTATQGANISDTRVSVLQISSPGIIDQINKGTYIFGWAGRVHRIARYVVPTFVAEGTYINYVTGTRTLTVENVAGIIDVGDVVTGTGFDGSQRVNSVSFNNVNLVTTIVLDSDASGTPSGRITFGVDTTGYLEIDSNPITNTVADGSGIDALTFKSKVAGLSLSSIVTFDIPFNDTATYPAVDSYLIIANNSNANYNGPHQITNITSKTVITVDDTTGLTAGMIVTSTSPGANIPPSCLIQSIDSPTQFTVSPAAWVPDGADVSSTVVATLNSVTITNGGSYTSPPQLTVGEFPPVNGEIAPAIITCTIGDSGEIDTVTVVSPGYGYTSVPTIFIEGSGGGVLTAVLTSSPTVNAVASAGENTITMTVKYDSDPGTFGVATVSKTITSFASKTTSVGEPYTVVLNHDAGTAATTDKWYYVSGNTNVLYNGFYFCTASTTSSITLIYPDDPGTWSTSTTTTVDIAITNGTSSSLGISTPFSSVNAPTLRIGYPEGSPAQITTRISTCRATGHDFLDIGTGGYSTTNYPYQIYGNPAQSRNESNEVIEDGVGRVFYVTTDQNGIFRVGRFFTVDQGTGTVTFSASIALSNLDGLGFKRGVVISEFSTDSTMTNNAPDTVPVQSAVRGYIDKRLGLDHGGAPVAQSNLVGPGYMALNGSLSMKGNLNMATFTITNLATPDGSADAANKSYVDAQVARFDQLSELNDIAFTSLANGNFAVYDSALGKWKNITLPTGDVAITYNSGAGTLTASIQSNRIVNSMVSATAGILQTKLAMNAATTRVNASGIVQADLGLASFDSANFEATGGWVGIKAGGVALTEIANIGNGTVLANFTGSATYPREVSAASLVSNGDGIKNVSFSYTSALVGGAMLVTYDGANTSNNTYSVIPVTAAGVRGDSSLVRSGPAGEVDVKQLKIDGYTTIDTTSTTLVFTTPGGVEFINAIGSTPLNTTITTVGTLDTSAGILKATALTTGLSGTSGTIVGQWQVQSNSQLDVSPGTLRSTTLTTGAETTAGSITGIWSLVGASKLQATYADIAEYYEGDQEYEPGTVLVFGGDKEVTTTTIINDTRSAGVVTTNPAYVMNSEQTGLKVCIALAGRVPCKIVGRVKKGDLLTTSATLGCAVKANDPKLGAIIGKALENKDYGEIGVIEVAIGRV
jgi:hypothetical protein